MFIGLTKDLNGAFAPYTVAHKSQLYRVPDDLSWEAAVMTEPTAVAVQAVFENRPSDSDRILVIGGGVIGNLIVQTVKALDIGCRISVVEPSGFAGNLARTYGAEDIIRPDEVYKKTSVITGARVFKPIIGRPLARGGFDKIYDTVGNSSTVNTGLRLLATGGTLSLVGIGSNLTIDPTTLWLKLQTVKGVFGYGRVDHQGRSCHAFDLALTLMNEGRIRGEALITHTFKLDDYREMIRVNMEKHRHGAMKTIVSFEDA
jgi:threonine dehydrogenase-like Zn-dependent dehydrogenase